MAFNRFSIHMFLYILMITVTALVFAFFLIIRQQFATALLCGLVLLFLAWKTLHHFNRTNRLLAGFMDYLRDNDPGLEYAGKFARRNFGDLEEKLRLIIEEVREKRMEEEMNAKYLQMVIDHMETGVLIVDHHGNVETMNIMARKHLGVHHLKTLGGLDRIHENLGSRISALKPGISLLEKLFSGNGFRFLSVKKALLALRGVPYEIISLNDIHAELEDKELESWKKLIRVLTHEIMNSITPITTLTAAVRRKFSKLNMNTSLVPVPLKDLQQGLESVDIIEERSQGLIRFIEKYQKLTRIPPLRITRVEIRQLFDRMAFLFREQLGSKHIMLHTETKMVQNILADAELLEQVLINLIKNSMESLAGRQKPEIRLLSYREPEGKTVIEVADNGCGIPEKDLEQVFVPFYSTKSDCSGIGLSFSRQVIRQHKAQITVSSKPGEGTVFRIYF